MAEGSRCGYEPGHEGYTLGSAGEQFSRGTQSKGHQAEVAKVLNRRLKTQHRPLFLEKKSVYGAAIAIPQLSRSVGWSSAFVFTTLKVYLFLGLNFIVQVSLLAAIQREELVMDLFSGQMNLCDFGAPIDRCPDDPSCTGPGGTKITGPRLYAFDAWTVRVFFRDSMKALEPDRAEEIDNLVDPGEYGAESRLIRWFCCFIFMIEVMKEFTLIVNMGRLLYHVPTTAESWVDVDRDSIPTAVSSAPAGMATGRLFLKVSGMPAIWKAVYVCVVLLPKCLLWKLTAEVGITFLMETASMDEMIQNSVALAFVLQVDESICTNLMSREVAGMLEDCEDFKRLKETRNDADQQRLSLRDVVGLLPWRLLITIGLCVIFILHYYHDKCKWSSEAGFYHSKDMHLPKTTRYPVLSVFFPSLFPVDYEEKPYWTFTPA